MIWLKVLALVFFMLGLVSWGLYLFADVQFGRLGTGFFLVAILMNFFRLRELKDKNNG